MPKWIECPYFRYEKEKYAYCELCRFKFPDPQTRREVLYQYCADHQNHKKCMLYDILERHYERVFSEEPTSDAHGDDSDPPS